MIHTKLARGGLLVAYDVWGPHHCNALAPAELAEPTGTTWAWPRELVWVRYLWIRLFSPIHKFSSSPWVFRLRLRLGCRRDLAGWCRLEPGGAPIDALSSHDQASTVGSDGYCRAVQHCQLCKRLLCVWYGRGNGAEAAQQGQNRSSSSEFMVAIHHLLLLRGSQTNKNPRSRSDSPSSVENAKFQVAKKVILLKPSTRPTLVSISSLGYQSKAARSWCSRTWIRGICYFRGRISGSYFEADTGGYVYNMMSELIGNQLGPCIFV